MKYSVLFGFRILLLMVVFVVAPSGWLHCEEIISSLQHRDIHKTFFSGFSHSENSAEVFTYESLQDMQDPEELLTKEEKKQVRREQRQARSAQRAERRVEIHALNAEEANIDNPNNADYIILGKSLPRGQKVITALKGRVSGLNISDDGYVMARGPVSFYGGGSDLFLVNGVEVSPDFVKVMSVNEVNRIEVFMGSSASIYVTRVGTAVISIYTVQTIE